jgi:hypothetical protein
VDTRDKYENPFISYKKELGCPTLVDSRGVQGLVFFKIVHGSSDNMAGSLPATVSCIIIGRIFICSACVF